MNMDRESEAAPLPGGLVKQAFPFPRTCTGGARAACEMMVCHMDKQRPESLDQINLTPAVRKSRAPLLPCPHSSAGRITRARSRKARTVHVTSGGDIGTAVAARHRIK
jgi:hypothetical protein